MKKKLIYILSIAFTSFLIISCSHSSSPSNYMVFENVRYVTAFPKTFSLDNTLEVNLDSIDIIGINDFCIYDSLLILSTTDREGLWSFVSLPDYVFIGKFFTLGQGPYEFTQSPYVGSNKVKFFKEKEELFAAIYHFNKGMLYKMNISESIKNKRLNIYTLKDSLPPILFNFVMIDSTTFFCKELNNMQTQQIRYILDMGKKNIPPHLEKLNLAAIEKDEDFNLLSTSTKHNINKNIIIEAPTDLNYINMYSVDGSFSKTICIGKKLDNIGKIQEKEKGDRMYTSADLRLFLKFWGVVYINEDNKTYQIKRRQLPNILLFDWNGEPLAKIKLNQFITSFDIDFINGYLYTFDVHTEMFTKYDIKEILKEL